MAFLFRRAIAQQQSLPSNQRAAIYDHRSPQNIRVITKEIPTLREGYSLVKVFCAGVNPVDAKVVVGDKFPEAIAHYFTRAFTNHVVGFDFSGQIVESTSDYFKPGDPVFGFNYQLPPTGFFNGGTLQEVNINDVYNFWLFVFNLPFDIS